MKSQKELIAKVNEQIIAKLETGINPWKKPWGKIFKGEFDETIAPMNYLTGKVYSGINLILLEPGFYLTFKQTHKLGGKVKKGAKAQSVVFSSPVILEVTDSEQLNFLNQQLGLGKFVVSDGYKLFKYENGKWNLYTTMLKEYFVFSLSDTEGCRKIKRVKDIVSVPMTDEESNAEAERIITDYCSRCKVDFKSMIQDGAYYRPSTHEVRVPAKNQYENKNEYYSTVFHELGHSTGHKSLLSRAGICESNSFGSSNYSKEELIAEITSAYSCSMLEINTDETTNNSVAYLQSWAKHLKDDVKCSIISATSYAEKAFKLIFNIE